MQCTTSLYPLQADFCYCQNRKETGFLKTLYMRMLTLDSCNTLSIDNTLFVVVPSFQRTIFPQRFSYIVTSPPLFVFLCQCLLCIVILIIGGMIPNFIGVDTLSSICQRAQIEIVFSWWHHLKAPHPSPACPLVVRVRRDQKVINALVSPLLITITVR